MAFTDNQKAFAYYVIATVESNCNYAAVNQNDPITLGILQWYGQNAYNSVLAPMKADAPDAFALLSTRLQDLTNGGAQTWNYWTNIYCRGDDADSFVKAAQLDSCHEVQDRSAYNYLFGDGEGGTYGEVTGWGGGSEVKTVISLMAICHQRPASANQCIAQLGANASIEEIRNWCLSNRILGAYKNRYNTVYSLLSGWDGFSAPPDFGQSDFTPSNDPTDNAEDNSLESVVSYVELVGDSLIIHGKMSSTEALICYKTNRNVWIPKMGTNVENPGAGSDHSGSQYPPASDEDPADFPAMRQLWYDNENAFDYSQSGGRLNPDTTGYTDCSACIYWAANKVTNSKYSWMGKWTGAMLANCPVVWEGSGPIPIDVLRPGDLILFGRNSYSTYHVEWYFGNGVVWGAGRVADNANPHFTTDDVSNINNIFGAAHMWVCRFLD